jgi:hypothetical protein
MSDSDDVARARLISLIKADIDPVESNKQHDCKHKVRNISHKHSAKARTRTSILNLSLPQNHTCRLPSSIVHLALPVFARSASHTPFRKQLKPILLNIIHFLHVHPLETRQMDGAELTGNVIGELTSNDKRRVRVAKGILENDAWSFSAEISSS